MTPIEQAKHTAQVFISECRSRRHGHGFWFAFRGAQNARRRVAALLAPIPHPTPALPAGAQMELFG